MQKTISQDFHLQVPFFDVDSMNIVWHGHYVKYLELARCQLLDTLGYGYREMADTGYGFPIVDLHIKYIKPLTFEQNVIITASLIEWHYRIKINYLIHDADSGDKLTKAHTIQAAVEKKSGNLCLECPPQLTEKVDNYLTMNSSVSI